VCDIGRDHPVVQQQPLVPLPPVWLTCHTHLQVCRALRPLRLGPRALAIAPRVPYQPSLSHQQDMLSEWLALSHDTPSMMDQAPPQPEDLRFALTPEPIAETVWRHQLT
jgi:hypothetical protein